MGAWARGCVGAWVRGRVGAWARGRVGAWARGRVGARVGARVSLSLMSLALVSRAFFAPTARVRCARPFRVFCVHRCFLSFVRALCIACACDACACVARLFPRYPSALFPPFCSISVARVRSKRACAGKARVRGRRWSFFPLPPLLPVRWARYEQNSSSSSTFLRTHSFFLLHGRPVPKLPTWVVQLLAKLGRTLPCSKTASLGGHFARAFSMVVPGDCSREWLQLSMLGVFHADTNNNLFQPF